MLFTGFRSRHDLHFFEKRVSASVFCVHQDKNLVQKVQKALQFYKGLAPSRAKNCVNTSVSASQSGQNTAIYRVLCLPRFLELQKTCKYQHCLRSTRQKCCNLQCFCCFAFQKHWYLQSFVHLWSKKYGIYSIFCIFALLLQKTLKRKNAVIYSILLTSKSYIKIVRKCVKTALFSDFRYETESYRRKKESGRELWRGTCAWRSIWKACTKGRCVLIGRHWCGMYAERQVSAVHDEFPTALSDWQDSERTPKHLLAKQEHCVLTYCALMPLWTVQNVGHSFA